jgi:hypothetical protein
LPFVSTTVCWLFERSASMKKLFFHCSFSWLRPSLALTFSERELPVAEAKPNSPEPVQPPLLAGLASVSWAWTANLAKAASSRPAIRVYFIRGRSIC